MNRATFRLFALALPLLGLAALWGWTDHRARQGTEWEVPVRGYDPRDLLRGHYITYQYDWPGLAQVALPASGWGELCLIGKAPVIERVELPALGRTPGDAPCPAYARADDMGSYRPGGLVTGLLYVPQDKARGLERQLADPKLQGVIRFRLRDDGHITPLSISFRPRLAQAAADQPM